jgi:hypothetical protein
MKKFWNEVDMEGSIDRIHGPSKLTDFVEGQK